MKKFLSALLCCLMLFGSVFAASCSSFFGDDSQSGIANIISDLQDDGTTKITIIYTDEDVPPTVFFIPGGSKGDIGNGIEDIKWVADEENSRTEVTIIYTDDDTDPTVLYLPYGTFITEVLSEDTEDGNVKLTIKFSGDIPDKEVVIKNGKDGTSITGTEEIENSDGSKTIIFYYSDGTQHSITIPAPEKGDPGASIDDIYIDDTGSEYIIYISYTDGTQADPIYLQKHNSWFTGGGSPWSGLGNEGDYYFDEDNKAIYYKKSSGWSLLADFSQYSDIEHKITFADSLSGDLYSQTIKHGMYFAAISGMSIPVPHKDGYQFLGWYTKRQQMDENGEPLPFNDPTVGAFNDLTVVISDLTVYSHWAKI